MSISFICPFLSFKYLTLVIQPSLGRLENTFTFWWKTMQIYCVLEIVSDRIYFFPFS